MSANTGALPSIVLCFTEVPINGNTLYCKPFMLNNNVKTIILVIVLSGKGAKSKPPWIKNALLKRHNAAVQWDKSSLQIYG